MKLIFFFLTLALLVSCSSSKKKNEKAQSLPVTTPAPQVQVIHPQTFSPDELARIELMERYRKMREETLFKKTHPKQEKKEKVEKIAKLPPKMRIVVEEKKEVLTATSALATVVVTPKPIATKEAKMNDDLRIQLDQHMSYYCIKFESRFSRPADCRAHAENTLKNCQDKKVQDPSLNLVQCLKKNM